jgi:uncharacterized protein (DUF433 family)
MIETTPITEIIPIYTDEHGRMRISGTRVLLDVVIAAYHHGASPEHIVQRYPSLNSEQVYLSLGYYLRHRAQVDAYLAQQAAEAEAFRQQWEAENPPHITRAELEGRLELHKQPKELTVEEKLALLESFKIDVPVLETASIRRVDWYGDDGR